MRHQVILAVTLVLVSARGIAASGTSVGSTQAAPRPEAFRAIGFGLQFNVGIPPATHNTPGMHTDFGKNVGFAIQTEAQFDTKGGGFSVGPQVRFVPGEGHPTAGLNARYQFRYFASQPVVPEVGYGFSFGRDNGRQWYFPHGPFVGTHVLLNSFGRNSSALLNHFWGVRRTDLVIQVQFPTEAAAFAGSRVATFAGVRFDW